MSSNVIHQQVLNWLFGQSLAVLKFWHFSSQLPHWRKLQVQKSENTAQQTTSRFRNKNISQKEIIVWILTNKSEKKTKIMPTTPRMRKANEKNAKVSLPIFVWWKDLVESSLLMLVWRIFKITYCDLTEHFLKTSKNFTIKVFWDTLPIDKWCHNFYLKNVHIKSFVANLLYYIFFIT